MFAVLTALTSQGAYFQSVVVPVHGRTLHAGYDAPLARSLLRRWRPSNLDSSAVGAYTRALLALHTETGARAVLQHHPVRGFALFVLLPSVRDATGGLPTSSVCGCVCPHGGEPTDAMCVDLAIWLAAACGTALAG